MLIYYFNINKNWYIMENYRNISENIKYYRYINNLTQEGLARASGVSLPTVKKAEGGASLRLSTLKALAQALDISIDELAKPSRRLKTARFRVSRELRSKEELVSVVISRLEDYNRLEKITGKYLPETVFSGTHLKPVEQAGKCRQTAGLDMLSPVIDVEKTVSALGVKLLSVNINTEKLSSLSVGRQDGGPAVVLVDNGHKSYEQAVFSIFHELGHMFMHRNIDKAIDDKVIKAEEDEADMFALHFLIPQEGLKLHWEANKGLHWTDRVMKIKHIFGVSYLAVLKRLGNYKELVKLFKADYGGVLKEGKEPETLHKKLYAEQRLGELAVEAVLAGKLTAAEGAEILQMDESGMKRLCRNYTASQYIKFQ